MIPAHLLDPPPPPPYKIDRAADGVNRLDFHLMNADKMHSVRLELPPGEAGDVLTVGHMARQVCVETGVDLWNQVLIFRGHRLLDMRCPLSVLGITKGVVVKLRRKEMAPQVEHYEYEMKLVEQDIDKTEKFLHSVIYKCDAIHRAYVPEEYNLDVMKRCRAALFQCVGELKDSEQQLNAMDLHSCDEAIKAIRRRLIRRIETYLKRIDSLDDGLRDISARLASGGPLRPIAPNTFTVCPARPTYSPG